MYPNGSAICKSEILLRVLVLVLTKNSYFIFSCQNGVKVTSLLPLFYGCIFVNSFNKAFDDLLTY